MMHEKLTKDLVGEKLSSVTFVLDYLQLDFDGNGFTMFIWPVIISENEKAVFGEGQYRNKLCALIAKVVTRIAYVEDVFLHIVFDEANQIKWPINPDNPDIIAEIGIYRNTEEEWFIFQ